MKFSKVFQAIDTHTGGQPTRILTGLFPTIPGKTMNEKRDYLIEQKDGLRQFLCQEPRGHKSMYSALLTEPVSPQAEVGVIFMSSVAYDNMCGHGTIGVVTALLESGLIDLDRDRDELIIDTPSGPVTTYPQFEDGKVKSVSFHGVPSFVYEDGVTLEVGGLGKVKGNLGFGGNWYFYVNANDLDLRVESGNVKLLLQTGNKIKQAVVEQFQFNHPTNNAIRKELTGVSIYEHPPGSKTSQTNIVVESDFFYDRSPCGTGTSGRMAILHSQGDLTKQDTFSNESITGSVFLGQVVEETKVGTYKAIVPKITGSAYITGFNQLVVDPEDPLKEGFLFS